MQKRCFAEELLKNTVFLVKYTTSVWSDSVSKYIENPAMGLHINVEEVNTGHVAMKQRGAHKGRFFYTASDSGPHSFCLQANSTTWFGNQRTKVEIELFLGKPGESEIVSPIEAKIHGLHSQIRDLNNQLSTIRLEQAYQKEREVEFRAKSEEVNSHAVWWILAQVMVLAVTCLWQMRHLKKFFQSKKLV